MNKRVKIILGIVLLILIALGSLLLFHKKEVEEDNNMNEAAQEYFKETLNSEVYVETLIENGYLKSSDKKCTLLKQDGDNIKEEKEDCDKAQQEAKKPVIVFTTTNGFKVNEWNKKGTTLKVSFKNDGNRYYKKEDITNMKWTIDGEGGIIDGDTIEVLEDIQVNETYILQIELKNGEMILEKKVDIKVDAKAPVIKYKKFDSYGPMAIYQDEKMPKVYYIVTTENKKPDKKDMVEKADKNFECGKKYYAWSYAKDEAGNESSIDFLGEYEYKCITISGGTSSGGTSSGGSTPNYSKPED